MYSKYQNYWCSILNGRWNAFALHLVNNKDWCRRFPEVISQLRINTENSHHRYDVIYSRINGLPVVQIELKNWIYRHENNVKNS